MPGFDAVKEATTIEKLVKDFMSHQNDRSTPEAARQAMTAAKTAIEKEMTQIWKRSLALCSCDRSRLRRRKKSVAYNPLPRQNGAEK
jgi:hypothetical protein